MLSVSEKYFGDRQEVKNVSSISDTLICESILYKNLCIFRFGVIKKVIHLEIRKKEKLLME